MGWMELLLTAFGLSMDAFAVAVTNGMSCPDLKKKQTLAIGLSFGLFQGLMPLAGFFLGGAFAQYMTKADHYIALVLLGYIGGEMICEAFQEAKTEVQAFTIKRLVLQSIATSIDAFAVGVSFAVLAESNIYFAVAEIAVMTCLVSLAGVNIGKKFGQKIGKHALFAGGMILICLGVKIFIEHQFFG